MSSLFLQGTRPRFASGTLMSRRRTPPLHPLRKTLSPRFSKGRAWVRDTGITNWKGRGLSPSRPFAGSAKPVW